MGWRAGHGCGEDHPEGVQPALERLHPDEPVVLVQRWRVQVDVLAEELRGADQGEALGLGSSLGRSNLGGHRGIIGVAKQHIDAVEAAGDELAPEQLLDGADAVDRLAQVQNLAGRDVPPCLRVRQSDA